MPAGVMALALGARLGPYEILAQIGAGGMGEVYRAIDTNLGRQVAIKVLPAGFAQDAKRLALFEREAKALASLNHPNIAVIHGLEKAHGSRALVMELVEGPTLADRIAQGRIPVDEALTFAKQIAEALQAAHAQGIIHRDLKPANIKVRPDGMVKLLDFGLAKVMDPAGAMSPGLSQAPTITAPAMTQAGVILGTASYMSPEQARGQRVDKRTDIWVFGCVLYEMLTGRRLFEGDGTIDTLALLFTKDPDWNALPAHVPRVICALLERCLDRDRRRRLGDVDAIRLVLDEVGVAKDSGGRFHEITGELARELRLVHGRMLPLDRSASLHPSQRSAEPEPASRARRRRLLAAILVMVVLVGGLLWIASPVERMPIAVAPLSNQTGDRELDNYRLALTHALTSDLLGSPNIRVLPYGRLLQILGRFRLDGPDISSREALQALATYSNASLLVVPTLVYENNALRARAEIRNSQTATTVATYNTDPVVPTLAKETAHGLMTAIAENIREHFRNRSPLRARLRDSLRSLMVSTAQPDSGQLRTLDAIKAFAEGIGWFEELEYAAAARSFASVVKQDPRSPLAWAWLSRVSQILRQSDTAREAADHATRLDTAPLPETDKLLIAAIAAEAQRDFGAAETHYRELVGRYADDSAWITELAAFEDRRGRTTDAIANYRQALTLDGRLARPHLELCRLYSRLNESASAEEEGELAVMTYRAQGSRHGEAQALMCLTDTLRLGDDKRRAEARENAEIALKIFQDLRYGYNLARAHYYMALAAEGLGRPADAVKDYEESLAVAREAGNVVLEPLVLMNLGAMQGIVGNQTAALRYHQQSHDVFEKFGDELRAAQSQVNVGAILIEYSGRRDEGLRDLQNALGVFRKHGDKNFEMFAAKVTATYLRYSGQLAEAERELNRALALAKEWGMYGEIPALTIDLARSRFDMGDYGAARDLLLDAVGDGSGKHSAIARIYLGRVHGRLGQFDLARADFKQALRDLNMAGHTGYLAILHTSMGDLAFQTGRRGDARAHLSAAVALWTDDLPEPASVEARAYLGLLDALEGRPAAGMTAVQSSLEHAKRTGPFSLEARCRIYLARIYAAEHRFEEAINALKPLAVIENLTLGSELQALVHYWRSRAMEGIGDRAGAQSEESMARKLIREIRLSLPEQYRQGFVSRPDIRPLVE
jgi:serine/threonine protein kinase/tetratricopeptide (TPR) repeat protein